MAAVLLISEITFPQAVEHHWLFPWIKNLGSLPAAKQWADINPLRHRIGEITKAGDTGLGERLIDAPNVPSFDIALCLAVPDQKNLPWLPPFYHNRNSRNYPFYPARMTGGQAAGTPCSLPPFPLEAADWHHPAANLIRNHNQVRPLFYQSVNIDQGVLPIL